MAPHLITLTITEFIPDLLRFGGNTNHDGKVNVKVELIPTTSTLARYQLELAILPPGIRFLFSNNKSTITGIYEQLRNGDIITKDVTIRQRANCFEYPPLVIRVDGKDMSNPGILVNANSKDWPYVP